MSFAHDNTNSQSMKESAHRFKWRMEMRKKLYLAASLGLSVMLMVAGIADYNSSYAKTKVTLAKGKSYKLKVTTIKKAKITVTVKKGKDKVKKVCHVTVTKSKAQNAVTPTAKPTALPTPTATDEPIDTHIKKEGDIRHLRLRLRKQRKIIRYSRTVMRLTLPLWSMTVVYMSI